VCEVITMLKRLLGCACLGLTLAACATTPPAPAKSTTAVAETQQRTGCVGTTATRLRVSPGECAGFGSTYTKQDLDSTGRVYAQDALRNLDPALTVRGP
jgi:hypothetical protein